MDIERVQVLKKKLETWIRNANPRLMHDFPLERYV
jgi:hypothetical protein